MAAKKKISHQHYKDCLMTGVDLTQDQVKRFNEKDVEKYFRRYETSLSSKTCDTMVDSFLQLG